MMGIKPQKYQEKFKTKTFFSLHMNSRRQPAGTLSVIAWRKNVALLEAIFFVSLQKI